MIVPSFACIVALLSFKRLFCRTAYANTQEVLQTMKKEYWQELVEKWEEADTNDDEHELGRGEEEEEKKLGSMHVVAGSVISSSEYSFPLFILA